MTLLDNLFLNKTEKKTILVDADACLLQFVMEVQTFVNWIVIVRVLYDVFEQEGEELWKVCVMFQC